jgi:hypothetical protein
MQNYNDPKGSWHLNNYQGEYSIIRTDYGLGHRSWGWEDYRCKICSVDTTEMKRHQKKILKAMMSAMAVALNEMEKK